MQKNEKGYITKNYLINGIENLQLFCCKTEGFNIFNKFKNSKPFNGPDMYYVDKNTCYIFEHFQIDASYFEEKMGSAYKRNRAITDKEINKKTNEIIKNAKTNLNEISLQGTISITTSQEANKENLKNNFFRIFDNHYRNIEQYKKNIIKETSKNITKFKTIFIIELTIEFGGWVYKTNKPVNLELFYCNFVLDKIKNSPCIDYFIFLNKSDNEKFFTIIKNGEFNKLNKHIFDYDKTKILFLNDITLIIPTIFIPNSIIKKEPKSNKD